MVMPISMLGMILGTTVCVYAGSRVPDLKTLQTEGVKAVFTPSQLTQIAIAGALIGLVPIIVKKLILRQRSARSGCKVGSPPETTTPSRKPRR